MVDAVRASAWQRFREQLSSLAARLHRQHDAAAGAPISVSAVQALPNWPRGCGKHQVCVAVDQARHPALPIDSACAASASGRSGNCDRAPANDRSFQPSATSMAPSGRCPSCSRQQKVIPTHIDRLDAKRTNT
jgi:hypothetical protein